MPGALFTCKAKVWLYPGQAAWHFLTLPKAQAKQIRSLFADQARGFGSLPVTVTLGGTTWRTSIFPDSKSGSYVLPLKAAVRKTEKVTAGETVTFRLEVRV